MKSIKNKIELIFFYTFMLILAAIFLFPIVWMVVSSFKLEAQIFTDLKSLKAFIPPLINPLEWFTPYKEVMARFNLFRGMANSFIYSGTVVAVSIIVNSLAGYALAKFNFPLKKLWMTLIVLIMIIPVETTIIPLFVVVNKLGLVNTYLGLIIAVIANPFNIFLFRQFFVTIPKEIEEAALIDGANRIQIFFKIVLPLSKSICATVAILTFIAQWNDFLWPVLMISDTKKYPLQVALNMLNSTDPVFTNQVMAALTISTIPIVLIYMFFQKHIVEGVAHTGGK